MHRLLLGRGCREGRAVRMAGSKGLIHNMGIQLTLEQLGGWVPALCVVENLDVTFESPKLYC